MNRYDKYKDSHVEWIGLVPEHWEVRRLKYIMQLCSEIADNNEKIGLENIESATGKYIETDSEFEGSGVSFQIDDIIYGKLRPYLKKVWLATFKGNAVGDFFVFRPSDEANAPYYKYMMLSEGFSCEANGATAGAKMPRVPLDFMLNMLLPFPPLSEQCAIAAYLDERCGRIDRVVEAERRRIALLNELRQSIITHTVTKGLNPNAPLKNSGVEWIGQVPEHWEVKRLKRTGVFGNGLTYSPNDVCTEDGILVLRSSNIQDSKIDVGDKVCVKSAPQDLMVSKGDIIICSRNGSAALVGKCALVSKSISATFGAFMMRYRPFINNKYAFYLFQTTARMYKEFYSTTTINQLTSAIINEMIVPLPPLSEQRAIASYLDARTAALDAQKAKSERRIALLGELKQSIITEAVTGKVKIA